MFAVSSSRDLHVGEVLGALGSCNEREKTTERCLMNERKGGGGCPKEKHSQLDCGTEFNKCVCQCTSYVFARKEHDMVRFCVLLSDVSPVVCCSQSRHPDR